MKKLTLDVDQLEVKSFATLERGTATGTVCGHGGPIGPDDEAQFAADVHVNIIFSLICFVIPSDACQPVPNPFHTAETMCTKGGAQEK